LQLAIHRRTAISVIFAAGTYHRDFGSLRCFHKVIRQANRATSSDRDGDISTAVGLYLANGRSEDDILRNLRLKEEVIEQIKREGSASIMNAAAKAMSEPQSADFYQIFMMSLPILEDHDYFGELFGKATKSAKPALLAAIALMGAYNRDFGRYKYYVIARTLLRTHAIEHPALLVGQVVGPAGALLRDMNVVPKITAGILASEPKISTIVARAAQQVLTQRQSTCKSFFTKMPPIDPPLIRECLASVLLADMLVPIVILAGACNRDLGDPAAWPEVLGTLPDLTSPRAEDFLALYRAQFKDSTSILTHFNVKSRLISDLLRDSTRLQARVDAATKGRQSESFYKSKLFSGMPLFDFDGIMSGIRNINDRNELTTLVRVVVMSLGYIRDHGRREACAYLQTRMNEYITMGLPGHETVSQWLTLFQ
jgi:hypothetical protein